jgi:hypothetical protein
MSRAAAPLVAFAYLAETAHEGGHNLDLISALAPLLGVIGAAHEGEPFQPSILAKELRERFGLRVNPYAVEQWIPQLKAAGVLNARTLPRPTSGKNFEQLLFAKPSQEFESLDESDVDRLVSKFKEYAAPRLARIGREIPDIELESFFLKEIADLDFLAAVLRTNKPTKAKPSLTLAKSNTEEHVSDALSDAADLDVLCAGFFLHASEEDPETFERIVTIASGAVISEVLFDVGNPQTGTSFKEQTLVLDCPICIKALGLNSREDEAHTGHLLTSIRERDGKLAVFDHTIEEIKSVLSAALKGSHEPWGYGPTVRRIRQDRNAEVLARAILADIESSLRAIDVKMVLSNPTSSGAWALLPQGQEELLAQKLAWYENPQSRTRDAASLAATYRLRGGIRTSPKNVHEARYLFLTENSRLVDVAYSFFSRDPDAPIAVTDRYLAGYLFVMCGGSDDIAGVLKKRVLANCSNAVAPRTDLIEKMAKFVANLDDAQRTKYVAMMTDERAARYLTEITFGNTGYLQADNFEEVLTEIYEEAFVERSKALADQKDVLEKARLALLAEIAESHNKEVTAIQTEKAAALASVDEKIATLAKEQAARERTQADLDQARSTLRTTLAKVAVDAKSTGQVAGVFLHLAYMVLAFMLAWVGDLIVPGTSYRFLYYFGSALLVLIALNRIPDVLIERPKRAVARWKYRRLVANLSLAHVANDFDFDASAGLLIPRSHDSSAN